MLFSFSLSQSPRVWLVHDMVELVIAAVVLLRMVEHLELLLAGYVVSVAIEVDSKRKLDSAVLEARAVAVLEAAVVAEVESAGVEFVFGLEMLQGIVVVDGFVGQSLIDEYLKGLQKAIVDAVDDGACDC